MKTSRLTTIILFLVCIGIRPNRLQADQPVVIIGPEAEVAEQHAASELQRYLTRMTGEDIAIHAQRGDGIVALIIGGLPPSEREQLGEEGYVLRCEDGGLRLAGGGSRGTLYAVYDFLERLGCRWYYMNPEDEVVPRLSTDVVVQLVRSGLRVEEKPAFRYRMMLFGIGGEEEDIPRTPEATREAYLRIIDWFAKNRINTFTICTDATNFPGKHWPCIRELFPEIRKRALILGFGGHCIPAFLPAEVLAQNPDWCPMVAGQRQVNPRYHFCTSSNQAMRYCLDQMLEFLKANPDIRYFTPWPKDGCDFCECPQCQAVSPGDLFTEYGNRITEELRDSWPRTCYGHLVYGSHRDPPDRVRLSAGMVLNLSTWGRNLGVPFDDPRTAPEYRELFSRWRETCARDQATFVLHEKYTRHLGIGFHPLPLKILTEDLRWFHKQGLDGFESYIAYTGRRTKSLNFHLYARLQWKLDTDAEAVVDDYFNRFYQSAAGSMRRAYEAVERAHPDLRYWMDNYTHMTIRNPPDGQFTPRLQPYTVNAIEQLGLAQESIREALDRTHDETIRRRIGRFGESVDYFHRQWQALNEFLHAARHMDQADRTAEPGVFVEELENAEKALQKARQIIEQLNQATAGHPDSGLYWDTDGIGPRHIVNQAMVEGRSQRIAWLRESGFAARPELIWRIGWFDGTGIDLGEYSDMHAPRAYMKIPQAVDYEVPADWVKLDEWKGFTPGHWPACLGHGAAINIHFQADAGEYRFTLRQLRKCYRPAIVPVLVNGRAVGEFTATVNRQTDHQIHFRLDRAGRHTLTLGEIRQDGSYPIDAVKLEKLKSTAPASP